MKRRTRQKPAPGRFTLVPGQEYRVLSIHPEWAWAIIFGGKDIENRSWKTDYRGTLLIHASSKRNSREWLEARHTICQLSGLSSAEVPEEFPVSSILGAVDLVDCAEFAHSPWGDGPFYWVLENPRALARPVSNVMGKLQIWRWTPSAQQVHASESGAVPSGRRDAAPQAVSGKAPPKQDEPRAARRIDDIPSDEILACLRASAGARPANEVEVMRAASRRLGFARMGARVEHVLRSHVKRAVRQGTLERDAMGLRTGTRG